MPAIFDAQMKLISRIRNGLRLLKFSEFSWHFSRCPFCGPTIILTLNATPGGLRCIRCAASTVQISLGLVLRDLCPDISTMDVCELSSVGPYARFLSRAVRGAQLSEFSAEVKLGDTRDGVRCEDAQRLTYASETFDLVTHTEVMEHVPDDILAFSELHRILKRGGLMLFTVPLSGRAETMERARKNGDEVIHLVEPVYHVDPWQHGAGILAYRDYGLDIIEKLERIGFVHVSIRKPKVMGSRIAWRDVVVAMRRD